MRRLFHFSLLNNSLYWAGGQFWGAKEIILNNNLYFLTFFLIERNFRLQFLMILTYPSGWSFIKNFFLLKLSLRIFAQENVLILVQFWKTRTPRWATARFKGTPSWSWGNVIQVVFFIPAQLPLQTILSYSTGSCIRQIYVENLSWVHFCPIEFTTPGSFKEVQVGLRKDNF